ncbi:MAG: translation elongation factor Ts [Planctomycetes bacterium]|nr:translation elongation factor Ts [Planctomycetota bacterium]
MAITAAQVRELRDMTDAPMMDCKKALTETGGDIQKAVDWLRERGVSKAAKKSGRDMTEGRVDSYIHTNGKVGVLLEMQCETDFCAKNDAFVEVARDICMHIAAADPAPITVSVEDVPADLLEKEEAIYTEQAKQSGKPEQFWAKIVDGRMDKYKKSVALLEQSFVKNPDQTIGGLVTELVAKLGENIKIRRFTKFRVGE